MNKKPKRRLTIKRMVLFLFILVGIFIAVTAVRLLMLRQDLADYKTYWSARAMEDVPENAITYVALGDSAAQGIGASRPEKGYVGLIEQALEEKNGKPVHVINLSVSGAKIQDVIDSQIPALNQLTLLVGTVVTLDIGGNDMGAYDAETFEMGIRDLFSRLPKQTVVADIPYFGGGRASKLERNASEASVIIEKVAKEQGLRMAPLHEVTKVGDGWMIYAADFFHPNDKGYRNWFRAFWQVL